MAGNILDKLLKAATDWVGAVGSGGVSDAVVTTIPLVSVVGLPTDTAIEITIDRVDANGTATPSKKEVIKGVVSGSNLINCERGKEGTAQAHSAGAVVEVMLTADIWNDMIDHHLSEHNQDGTHKNIAVTETLTPAPGATATITPTINKVTVITMPAGALTLEVDGDVSTQVFIVEIINASGQGALTWFDGIDWAYGEVGALCGTDGKKDTFGFRVTSAGHYNGYIMGGEIG